MKTLAFVLLGLVATVAAKANYSASEKFAQTYPVSARTELSLSNVNGSVEIIAWDKNEVSIEAEKRAPSTEELPNITIKIDATPDRIVVKTEHKRTGWFGSSAKGAVTYVVHVPAYINLHEIESVNSNITIHNVDGVIEAGTVNGSIRVTDITNSARLHTVNGNIDANITSYDQERKISAETVNGSCKFIVASNIAVHVRGSTVNGHVKSSLPLTDITSSKKNLEGRMGTGAAATIEASTVNGNIAFNGE